MQERFATSSTFNSRTLKIGDRILVGLDLGGTVYLYPAVVCQVTGTGPDDVLILGKGLDDFESSRVDGSAESILSYGSGKTAADLGSLEWIFLDEA